MLERGYRYSRGEVAAILAGLLSSDELTLEVEDELEHVIELSSEEGYGIADLMIAAAAGGSARRNLSRSTGNFLGLLASGSFRGKDHPIASARQKQFNAMA